MTEDFEVHNIGYGSSLVLLLLGIPFYHSKQLPLIHGFAIICLFKAALKKRHLNYPSFADQFSCNDDENELPLSTIIKLLRYILKEYIPTSHGLKKLSVKPLIFRNYHIDNTDLQGLFLYMFWRKSSHDYFTKQLCFVIFFPKKMTNKLILWIANR